MSQDLIPTNSSTSLTTTKAASRRQLEARIEELHGHLAVDPALPTRFSVPRALAATTAERRALSVVRDRLEAELKPWEDRDLVDAVIGKMLKGFELGQGLSEMDRRVLNGEFIDAVRKLPLWAIKAAAERFRDRENLLPWNSAFRPNPAQFAEEAREGMIPHRKKLLHTNRVMNAEVVDPPSPAQRDRVAKLAAAFRAQSMAGADGRPMPTESEIGRAREAALREHGAALTRSAANGGLAALTARLDAKKRGGRPAQGEAGQEFTGEGGHA